MLDIVCLIGLCKWIGGTLREKGRTPIGYQVFTVMFWIACELGGMLVGVIVAVIVEPDATEPNLLYVILGAIAGMLCCAVPVFLVIKFIPPVVEEVEEDYEDGDFVLEDSGL